VTQKFVCIFKVDSGTHSTTRKNKLLGMASPSMHCNPGFHAPARITTSSWTFPLPPASLPGHP
jgi:hypothetical protein